MVIQREFKALLNHRLNQLNHQSYTVIERWELLAWYGRDRVTNVIWRDIQESWESFDWTAVKGGIPEIGVIKTDDSTSPQTFVLVRKDSIKPIDDFM